MARNAIADEPGDAAIHTFRAFGWQVEFRPRFRRHVCDPSSLFTILLTKRKRRLTLPPVDASLNQFKSVELVLPIRAHRGSVRVHFGAEVTQRDERLSVLLFEGTLVFVFEQSPE